MMSRICPLQLQQGAQTYLGCSAVHRLVLEGLEDLAELAPPGQVVAPVGEVVAGHDGEARAAAAAVVVDAVRRHLAEPALGHDRLDDLALGRHDAHQAHHVAGVVQGDREVVAALVELDLAGSHDVAQDHDTQLSRGMLRSPVSTLSAITVSALWAWPHSPRTIFFTPSFLAAAACWMATRANWTSSYQTP